MKSPIYWNPSIYHLAIRLSYKKDFKKRYLAIEKLIPAGACVTEVCMGDAYLYRNYLSKKNVKYIGLDINKAFVQSARKENINTLVHNLLTDTIPKSDYIIMHGSLYQFIPNHHFIIKKLLEAARKFLIISEPVKNMASSSNPFLSFMAKHAANPGSGPILYRFNRKSLMECFDIYLKRCNISIVEDGKDIIGIFKKDNSSGTNLYQNPYT